jgi:hypothetical protein
VRSAAFVLQNLRAEPPSASDRKWADSADAHTLSIQTENRNSLGRDTLLKAGDQKMGGNPSDSRNCVCIFMVHQGRNAPSKARASMNQIPGKKSGPKEPVEYYE